MPVTQNKNQSPWIKELTYDREIRKLEEDIQTDVAIIGGGISGITTAFFILTLTEKNIVLLEATKIGHGATGHNAGQVVDYFEKSFTEIIEEYGLELASNGQKSISSAWKLLDEILLNANIKIPYSKFTGYAGCTGVEQLYSHFDNKLLKIEGGVGVFKTKVSKDFAVQNEIPEKYSVLYELVEAEEILNLLETNDKNYIAALQAKKGCLNSALFVEKLEKYLSSQYKDRFKLFEHTKVKKVFLDTNEAVIEVKDKLIDAKKVVLCTNGFENIDVLTKDSPQLIHKIFHKSIYSVIGYMGAYIEKRMRKPNAISYFTHNKNPQPNDPYTYLTRRNRFTNDKKESLVCIGGPEMIKDKDHYRYSSKRDFPMHAQTKIENFLNEIYKFKPNNFKGLDFKWHGLMGYTESRIRLVGVEPENNVLLYNLGCNGVGILPSIFGAKKIADHIAGKDVPKSIFDPEVQRGRFEKKNS